jgi:hypothetical protein
MRSAVVDQSRSIGSGSAATVAVEVFTEFAMTVRAPAERTLSIIEAKLVPLCTMRAGLGASGKFASFQRVDDSSGTCWWPCAQIREASLHIH